ncbi:MAG: nuclear transport factor 2 family protein [Pseudomonadota bacterium]
MHTPNRIPPVVGRSHTALFHTVTMVHAVLLLLLLAPAVVADDRLELQDLLDEFLSHVDDPAMHERFWDDALVYTSSSGARFGKADILAGMQADSSDAAAGEGQDSTGGDAAAAGTPVTRYEAEDVQVALYGESAVVAFRLVALTTDGATADPPDRDEYFNTGTFLRRGDGWRVVAWQATRIPVEND